MTVINLRVVYDQGISTTDLAHSLNMVIIYAEASYNTAWV